MEEIIGKKREIQVGQDKHVVRVLSNGEKYIIQLFINGKLIEAKSIKVDQLEDVDIAIDQISSL